MKHYKFGKNNAFYIGKNEDDRFIPIGISFLILFNFRSVLLND